MRHIHWRMYRLTRFPYPSKRIAPWLYYKQAESGCADCRAERYVEPWVICASCTIVVLLLIWGRVIVPSFSVIAQLQAYTPGSGPSITDNRASTTDRERLMRSLSRFYHISDPRFMQGRAMKTPQEEPVGMDPFTLSCSSHVACQIGISQKVSRGACPARAVGQETRVVSRAFVFSSRMKSRTSLGSASLRTRRLMRRP